MAVSIFESKRQAESFFKDEVFAHYRVTIQVRDRIFGGVPKDPKVIESWLRSKAGIEDAEEIRQATLRTLMEMGADVDAGASYEDLMAATEKLASEKQTNGFKRDEDGLYIESRQVKAMLKESANILFIGEWWGQYKNKKGNLVGGKIPKSFVAERVYVNPDKIHLGVTEPSGVQMNIVHADTPQGPRSSLSYAEYVVSPAMEFRVLVARDVIPQEKWAQVWIHAQENGLGANRSQGGGRFDVTAWERL